jgi:RNA polymerase sigma factor
MSSIKLKSLISGLKDKAVENKIKEIQKGNEDLRNDFIQQYRPFIKKVASKVCKRYINDSMDEYSIGLLAFNEAIDQYTDDQGAKFLTFANMVIQRRIIDHIRKEERQNRNIYLDRDDNEEEDRGEESYAEKKAALDQYDQEKQAEIRLQEIEEYRNLLEEFKISFATLSKECPKHVDARENAINIAKMVAKSEVFTKYLLERKQLPIKDLLEHVDCSRKTIERNRKYIIAIALIYIGKFTALASYIDFK